MKLKVYTYSQCNTCRVALKFLVKHGVEHTEIPIRENPPSRPELRKMLAAQHGQIRSVFNTHGMDYRVLKLKDKVSAMTESEAIELLAANGSLVKRPFLIGDGVHLVGFYEDQWRRDLL